MRVCNDLIELKKISQKGAPFWKKWTPKNKKGDQMKQRRKTFRYSRLFKEEVLREIQRENLTLYEASKYYGIPFQTIYRWLKLEGTPNPKMEVFYMSLSKEYEMLNKLKQLKKENQGLKEALSELTLKNLCLEELVYAAKRNLGIDLKKNLDSQQQKLSGIKLKRKI